MFLFHLGQAGRHRQAAEDAPSLDPRRLDSIRREPLRSGAPLGPQKSQSPPPLAHTCRLVAVALHIHLAGTKKNWSGDVAAFIFRWRQKKSPDSK